MWTQPEYAVSDQYLLTVNSFPSHMQAVPTSKMFVVKKALKTYLSKMGAGAITYDASQGDGGESLSGVPTEILERAYQLQREVGTSYDTPAGNDRFRRATAEQYWKFEAETGWGPANILAGQGGRDILMKVYSAMIYCGRGRIGDALITSAVPWISYNWGPYAAGLNVLHAPGDPSQGWAYSEEALAEAVNFAHQHQQEVAGLVITSPDNPTGRTMPLADQIALAQKALELGVQFILFDWIYHWVTEGQPHDINVVLKAFSPEDRKRLMFLDGLTKSLGGSNIRGAHLVADTQIINFITSYASHGVIPSFYSQAVAIAAYEIGYAEACKPIVEPTNASRRILRDYLEELNHEFIMGDGYYAFINTAPWIQAQGYTDGEALGARLAEDFGLAIVPGIFFAPAAKDWVRFSYALPPERTAAAAQRLHEALIALA